MIAGRYEIWADGTGRWVVQSISIIITSGQRGKGKDRILRQRDTGC